MRNTIYFGVDRPWSPLDLWGSNTKYPLPIVAIFKGLVFGRRSQWYQILITCIWCIKTTQELLCLHTIMGPLGRCKRNKLFKRCLTTTFQKMFSLGMPWEIHNKTEIKVQFNVINLQHVGVSSNNEWVYTLQHKSKTFKIWNDGCLETQYNVWMIYFSTVSPPHNHLQNRNL